MIDYTGWNEEPTFEQIAMKLGNSRYVRFSEPENVYYLAGGYWRAHKVAGRNAVCLINPDRIQEDINKIEEAICLLCGFTYVSNI